MNKELYNWMKQWSDLVNKETPTEIIIHITVN